MSALTRRYEGLVSYENYCNSLVIIAPQRAIFRANHSVTGGILDKPYPRHIRRNFILFFLDMLGFSIAFNLIGANTVVPDFVSRLTPSQEIVGLSGSLFNFAFLMPQLFLAQIVNRGTRRKPYMARTVIPSRLAMAAVALFITLV